MPALTPGSGRRNRIEPRQGSGVGSGGRSLADRLSVVVALDGTRRWIEARVRLRPRAGRWMARRSFTGGAAWAEQPVGSGGVRTGPAIVPRGTHLLGSIGPQQREQLGVAEVPEVVAPLVPVADLDNGLLLDLAQLPQQPGVEPEDVHQPGLLSPADGTDVADQQAGGAARDGPNRRVVGPLVDDPLEPTPAVVEGRDPVYDRHDAPAAGLVVEVGAVPIDPGGELGGVFQLARVRRETRAAAALCSSVRSSRATARAAADAFADQRKADFCARL
ncbi:MAG TPA: hypothetical protein VG406_09815 [Isosphaeraceae bacterium]|nr:hypothetical protein [Isosphaeraceae bacterium]